MEAITLPLTPLETAALVGPYARLEQARAQLAAAQADMTRHCRLLLLSRDLPAESRMGHFDADARTLSYTPPAEPPVGDGGDGE